MLVGAFVATGCDEMDDPEAVDDGDVSSRQYTPWPADPALQLDLNFEDGTVGPLGQELEGKAKITVIEDEAAAYSGSSAVRMTLGGAKTYRAELKSASEGRLNYGSEYWLGFAFRVEKWEQTDWGMIFQTHAVPSTWDCTSGRNPVSITMSADGKLGLSVINDPKKTKASGGAGAVGVWKADKPVDTSAWQRWVLHIKPSAKDDGIIQAWLNGRLLYERTGANVDALDTCGLAQDDWIYTKFGIYKTYDNTGAQAVVYDDIRIHEGPHGYNKVRPPGLPALANLVLP